MIEIDGGIEGNNATRAAPCVVRYAAHGWFAVVSNPYTLYRRGSLLSATPRSLPKSLVASFTSFTEERR